MRDLTPKQRAFAEALARGMSQSEAARVAGSSKPGLMGSKWMKSERVRMYLDELRAEANRLVVETAAATALPLAVSTAQTARDMAQLQVYAWEMLEGSRPAEFIEGGDGQVKLKRFKPHAALATLWEMHKPQDRGGTVNVQVVNQLPESAVTQVYRALLAGANGNGHHPPEEAP